MIPNEIRPEINKQNTKLCLADGGLIDTLGYVYLPIQINDTIIKHKFTIAEVDVPAVIDYKEIVVGTAYR